MEEHTDEHTQTDCRQKKDKKGRTDNRGARRTTDWDTIPPRGRQGQGFLWGKHRDTGPGTKNTGNVWDKRVGTRIIVFCGPESHFYCVPGFPDYSDSTIKCVRLSSVERDETTRLIGLFYVRMLNVCL